MKDSRYSAPKTELGNTQLEDRGPTPPRVVIALRLLWLSLALGLVVAAISMKEVKDTGRLALYLLFYVLFLLLNGFILLRIARGHDWARVTYLVLFAGGLAVLFALEPPPNQGALEQALNVAGMVLDATALYLLFAKPGSEWFARARRSDVL